MSLGCEDAAVAEDLEGEQTLLKDFAIQVGDGLRLEYPLGCFDAGRSRHLGSDLGRYCLGGPVGVLSCFGLASKVAHRLLPPGSLKKPVKLSVAACHSGSMTEKAGEETITVWLGYVDESLAEKIDFSEDILPSIGFAPPSEPDLLPFAGGLVSAAEEKYNYRRRVWFPRRWSCSTSCQGCGSSDQARGRLRGDQGRTQQAHSARSSVGSRSCEDGCGEAQSGGRRSVAGPRPQHSGLGKGCW